jgi:hypothetical protein
MKYGEIFSTSWKIIWKFKALWIFGILSSCMRSGNHNSSSNGSDGGSSLLMGQGNLASLDFNFSNRFYQWTHLLQIRTQEDPWIIAVMLLAAVLLVVCLVLLGLFAGTLGRVGVARGSWLADDGHTKLGFSTIFKESLPYFWRVFLLFVLIFFVSLLLVIFLVLPIVLITVLSFGLIWLVFIPFILPLGVLFVLAMLAVRALIEESIVAIIGEDLGLWQAIGRAWKLLIEKPFPQLWVSFLLSLIEFMANLVFALPFLLLLLPLLFSLLFQSDVALGIGAGLSGISFLIYLPLLIIASGILYAYVGAAWSLTFRRLTGKTSNFA